MTGRVPNRLQAENIEVIQGVEEHEHGIDVMEQVLRAVKKHENYNVEAVRDMQIDVEWIADDSYRWTVRYAYE